jgi:uncharacterized protein YdgA (DUF945 family)
LIIDHGPFFFVQHAELKVKQSGDDVSGDRTLSARNKELETAVETYYKNYFSWLIDLISTFSKEPEIVVSLLVPFVEGVYHC